ncbi:MAG TPA: transglycosylase family protein [Solirubrobacterales bacterium]|nr:transglycosylase family protein [Solirubrobacterales bacterium]
MLLAFPAVALAADGGEGKTSVFGLAPARVAPDFGETLATASPQGPTMADLKQPVHRFHRLVETISQRIKAEERAAARERERQREERFDALGVSIATLESIASCESGGDPTAVSADGSYRGKYQFDFGTWESVGGSGDPAVAPEAEQDYRAALLYSRAGSSPWPVCG